MLTEKQLQNYLFKRADIHDIFCRKMAVAARRGFPDVMLAKNGRVVFVELKSPSTGGVLSKLQKRELSRLNKAGLKTYVTSSKEGVDDIVEQLINT